MEMQESGPHAAQLHAHAWQALAGHLEELRPVNLRQLFIEDPTRGTRLTLEAAGWYLDYSKNRVTPRTLQLLAQLAKECRLPARIDAMFQGDAINASEGRAALHVALRMPAGEAVQVDGRDVVPTVHKTLRRMAALAVQLRGGACLGGTGVPIRNVINLGIGGSAIGVEMACAALEQYAQPGLRVRFVSNVDGADFAQGTQGLDPRETLFIVCSKSWQTSETRHNAAAARAWCMQALPDEDALQAHFVAVTGNREAAIRSGIAPDRVLDIWDWVNGRYSLCSAMGLALMVATGPDAFNDMLAGCHDMDTHFRSAPLERNLPVIHGLMAIWNNNCLGARTAAVLPYEHHLRRFPAYVQQLMMESNGKSVTQAGAPVGGHTSPVYWGACGTNGQHSFHQLLHQGSQMVPCDFIGFLMPLAALPRQHEELLANMFAQAEALAFGQALVDDAAAAPHRHVEGNRPSNTLISARLTPRALGALVAMYEHSAFTQGAVWNIDSFDQWGVELGKTLALRIVHELDAGMTGMQNHDSSTRALMQKYLDARTGKANRGAEQ
ncbi:glucose-6-phosphate isomerase [Achromobacter sp. UMC46]|uniref:glucose-6-phosphate isomerase n=1 Tax=Achromobacter sp. UMC46 TaxID=1862319 RepID=UPI0016048B8C|nr:glucose-6-phosphate isomerase [Achromobacter sp. UMC46]MBB1593261.1 glucose-6-phosphate isomerase [Achromobacter sp. UMC46]